MNESRNHDWICARGSMDCRDLVIGKSSCHFLAGLGNSRTACSYRGFLRPDITIPTQPVCVPHIGVSGKPG